MIEQIKRSLINFFVQIANKIMQFINVFFAKSYRLHYQSHPKDCAHRNNIQYTNAPHNYSTHRTSNLYQPNTQSYRNIYQSPLKYRIPQLELNRREAINKQNLLKKCSSHDKYLQISDRIVMPKKQFASSRYPIDQQRLKFTQQRQSDYHQYYGYYFRQRQARQEKNKESRHKYFQYGNKLCENRRFSQKAILKSYRSVNTFQSPRKFDFRRFAQIS